MNSNNILTNEFKTLPIFKRLRNKPKKWQGMFNFKNIKHNLMINDSFLINGCSIKRKNGTYICYPLNYKKPHEEKLSLIQGLNLETIHSLNNLKPVTFNELDELVFYVYLDLIINFIKMSKEDFNKITEEQYVFFNKFYRASVLEVNKCSVYLERSGRNCISNRKITEELTYLFLSLKIKSLELPMGYDLRKTIQALTEFKDVMDKIKLPIKARKFNLKFKKLGIYKDNGFYSKETNTIIIDARKTEVFIHELGHMIYDNNIKINKKFMCEDSEDYANTLSKYLI